MSRINNDKFLQPGTIKKVAPSGKIKPGIKGPKPINSKAPTPTMKIDNRLVSRMPITSSQLKTIKRSYGIK